MMVKAGRWQELTMTERWLILNGLAAIQARRRTGRARSISVTRLTIHANFETDWHHKAED